MKTIQFIILSILSLVITLLSCNNNVKNTTSNQVIIQKDTVYIVSKDTIFTSINTTSNKTASLISKTVPINKKDSIITKKEITPTKPTIITNTAETTDFIIYYKGTRTISTLTTPWKNEKRKILFYDKQGNKTYEIEDVRHSYSSITTLRYHDDGSVIDALTHLNPGASMYWYETITRFDKENEPLNQETTEYPEKLSVTDNNKLKTWDKINKKWN